MAFLLIGILLPLSVFGYLSPSQNMILHDFVDRMGKEFMDLDAAYIEPLPSLNEVSKLIARANKDLEAEQLDYDSLLNVGNSNPSIRDQEYPRHSTLWGHQFITGGGAEVEPHNFKTQSKTDATLPAYCDPPNPCPVGFTEDQGCQTSFENTAAFSRDYQSSQECMCDGEHMFDCPSPKDNENVGRQINNDFEHFFARQMQQNGNEKGFISKKYSSSAYRVSFMI